MYVIKLYRYAIYHHLRFHLHRPFDGGEGEGRYNYIFVNTILLLFFCRGARLDEEQQAWSERGMTGACPAEQINQKKHLITQTVTRLRFRRRS